MQKDVSTLKSYQTAIGAIVLAIAMAAASIAAIALPTSTDEVGSLVREAKFELRAPTEPSPPGTCQDLSIERGVIRSDLCF